MILTIILICVAILVFFILVIGGWVIGLYNGFVNGKQNIRTQWSNILAEYQRRADLFYNLSVAVKSYAKFEKETMTAVIQARSGNFGSNYNTQVKKVAQLDDVFSGMLSKLAVVFERYPNLKAIAEYDKLMKEIRITEDRINIARSDYNEIIRDYNVMANSFPNLYFSKMWGIKEEDYYQYEAGSEQDYKINLD